jgi:hypothetical protein
MFSVSKLNVPWCRHRVKLKWTLCDVRLFCNISFSRAFCEGHDKFHLRFKIFKGFNIVLSWFVKKLKSKILREWGSSKLMLGTCPLI